MLNKESFREYKSRIRAVIDYVEKDTREDLNIEVLAEVACFSPYHFHRVFHAFVGETPKEFVNRIRLEKAASRLITYPKEQVTVVAQGCGFSSSAAFARAFKEYFGCSASEWRSGRLEILEKSRNRKDNGKDRIANTRALGFVVGDNGKSTEAMKELLINPEVKSMPSHRVAFLAHLGDYSEKTGRLFDALRHWAEPRGLITSDTRFIGICLDNPKVTAPERGRYYACMTVPADVRPEEGINLTEIPAARCAVARFEGSRPEIPLAYDELYGKFIPENGYQPADRPAYEIHYGNPRKDPERKSTLDLCVPVEPLG